MTFFDYLLRCHDGSYVGRTEDLEYRVAQNRSETLGGYAAGRLPVLLEWSQDFSTRDELSMLSGSPKAGAGQKSGPLSPDWERIWVLARNRQM